METVYLNITGMACGGCAHTVRQALLAVDGVDGAEVSHETGRASVSLAVPVDVLQLEAAVRAAGFGIAA